MKCDPKFINILSWKRAADISAQKTCQYNRVTCKNIERGTLKSFTWMVCSPISWDKKMYISFCYIYISNSSGGKEKIATILKSEIEKLLVRWWHN